MEHTGRAVAQRRSLNRSKAYGSDRRTALQGTRFRACTGTGTAFTVLTVKRVVRASIGMPVGYCYRVK
eukprot:scaffold136460_cov178-Phaeocystis_antarctica.AAC.1